MLPTIQYICLDKSFEKFSFFDLFFYRLIDSSFVLFSWILSSIALEEVFSGAKQQRYLSFIHLLCINKIKEKQMKTFKV